MQLLEEQQEIVDEIFPVESKLVEGTQFWEQLCEKEVSDVNRFVVIDNLKIKINYNSGYYAI